MDLLLDLGPTNIVITTALTAIALISLGLFLGWKMIQPDLGSERAGDLLRRRMPVALAIVGAVVLVAILGDLFTTKIFDWFLLLVSLLMWGVILSGPVLRRRLGPSIIRLPWAKWNFYYMALGAFMVLWSLVDLFLLPPLGETHGFLIIRPIFLFSVGVAMVSVGLNRFEIRRGGIIVLDNYLPWKKISGYRFEGEEQALLRLEMKRRLPGYQSGYWIVPNELRTTVAQALEQHVRAGP